MRILIWSLIIQILMVLIVIRQKKLLSLFKNIKKVKIGMTKKCLSFKKEDHLLFQIHLNFTCYLEIFSLNPLIYSFKDLIFSLKLLISFFKISLIIFFSINNVKDDIFYDYDSNILSRDVKASYNFGKYFTSPGNYFFFINNGRENCLRVSLFNIFSLCKVL